MAKRILYAGLALPLAAFFAFVGWHKAFSPLAELLKHQAYTVHLPEWLGRTAGWLEMASALALLAGIVPRWRRGVLPAAGFIVASQVLSSILHAQHGEMHFQQQNAVIALAALVLAWLARPTQPTE